VRLKLSEDIISPEDLKQVITEIRDYSKWMSKNTIKIKVTKKKAGDEPELSDAAADLIKQWKDGKDLSPKILDKLIEELQDYLAKMKTIRVTFAALPTNKTKQQFTKWFRDNLSDEVLIDFRFNSTLLGGMVVNCGSHIYDWSFRRQLLENKDKFSEVVHRV
jgi:hypothetical protein